MEQAAGGVPGRRREEDGVRVAVLRCVGLDAARLVRGSSVRRPCRPYSGRVLDCSDASRLDRGHRCALAAD
ncbi:MAG: hypothetical protein IT371_29695 [Deltaproteobacteria bacterium]|nr:hypothetical protein [Deltaproteobacteria bacterium]